MLINKMVDVRVTFSLIYRLYIYIPHLKYFISFLNNNNYGYLLIKVI